MKKWLFNEVSEIEGPTSKLAGIRTFVVAGYVPNRVTTFDAGLPTGIAFLAAGALSPFATLVLVLLTLFGALPMYWRVAEESPHGDGSISMLERLLSRWKGKMFVLVLLGFVATSFIITVTLSAADATAHIIENPYVEKNFHFLHHEVIVTLVLIGFLGAVFLRGFNEVIGIAVIIVVVFLGLNMVIIGVGSTRSSLYSPRC